MHWMVLHRPVELARLIGRYKGPRKKHPYFTTKVKKLAKVCVCPLNVVVNDNVYVPGGVAPLGPCGKLLHAADPSPTSNNVANVTATRRFPRNTHTPPPSTIVTSSSPTPPPIGGTNPVAVVAPWQNDWIPNAISVVPPFNVTVFGITLHVITTDDGTHPSCTVPVTPSAPLIINPKYAVPPGTVVAVVDPPGGTVMITCDVTPMPLNATICGLPVALSAMFNVAVNDPFAPGVNTTLIVQLAPAASVPDALHPALDVGCGTAKSPAFAPLIVKPANVTVAVLVFITVTVSAALVVLTACDPNVKLLGVTVSVAVPLVPVPVSVTICGPPVALSVNKIVPVRVPVAVGLNVIENTHGSASTAMLGHCANVAPAKSPLVTMLVNVNGFPPVFDTVTICAALVVPTAWLPNVNEAGVIPIVVLLLVPVPAKITDCGLPVALSVNVIAPERVPVAVGVNVIWNLHGVPPTAMLGHCASVAPAKSPVVTMLVNVTVDSLVFVTVTVCAALVVPTA
jgi:hypothetical protein